MLPYSLFLSLAYWIYPLKDYIGETGCYLLIYGRDIGSYITSTHSFFMAMFRYNCLFNGHFLKKINLSPNVSSCFKSVQTKVLYMSSSFFLFGVETRDFSHAEKERTACKAGQIYKTTTILTQNGPRLSF